MENNNWKKVEVSQTPAWDPNQEKEVAGILKQVKTKVGPNESNLYVLKREGKEDIAVWGSTVIDSRMEDIELGSEVKIVFLGEATSEKTGRNYKNYEVYTKDKGDDEIPVIEDGEPPVGEMPF